MTNGEWIILAAVCLAFALFMDWADRARKRKGKK